MSNTKPAPMTMARILELRAAVARAARDERRRTTEPGTAGRYAGHYRGAHRSFDLVWVPEEFGYRRIFPCDSAWTWEDPTIFSASEAETLTKAGNVGRSSATCAASEPSEPEASGSLTKRRASQGDATGSPDQRGHDMDVASREIDIVTSRESSNARAKRRT